VLERRGASVPSASRIAMVFSCGRSGAAPRPHCGNSPRMQCMLRRMVEQTSELRKRWMSWIFGDELAPLERVVRSAARQAFTLLCRSCGCSSAIRHTFGHHDISPVWKTWFSEAASEFGFTASALAGLHFHFFVKTRQTRAPGRLRDVHHRCPMARCELRQRLATCSPTALAEPLFT